MKISAIVFLFLFCSINMLAQNVTGEYYLNGVMETASSLKLNADSSFEFFFSYGSLDRYGKGKWSLQNNSVIILNSEKRPPLDFKLEKASTADQKNIIIQIDNENKNILRYVQGFVKTKSGEQNFEMNDDGIAEIKNQPVDSIGLIFTLCPDRYSVIPVSENNNHFVFRIEPWIATVFFDNFTLHYSDNMLKGKHPLLTGNEYNYKK